MQTVGEVFCTSPQPLDQPRPSIMAADQSSFSYQFSERQEEKWSQSYESDGVIEGLLREIDVKGHEMMRKLVSRVENDVPFEEVFKETWHHLGGKPAASRMLGKIARKMGRDRDDDGGFERRERGVEEDDDLQLKNERFKVKTLNVKEEEAST